MRPLIGVTELSLHGRGPKQGFLFDAHRLALPCWAKGLGDVRGAVLVTLDRHWDTVPPRAVVAPGSSLEAVERFAHDALDARNFDHLLAAMELGLVSDAVVLARARPQGSVGGPTWTDSRGQVHRLFGALGVDALLQGPDAEQVMACLEKAPAVLLDVDLDCFSSLSDADPTTVVPWPRELIRQHVLPRGSEAFWRRVLERCAVLTFAREPGHCGGVVAGDRLFAEAAQVVFCELLGGDLP